MIKTLSGGREREREKKHTFIKLVLEHSLTWLRPSVVVEREREETHTFIKLVLEHSFRQG